jgi:hypothetical protein
MLANWSVAYETAALNSAFHCIKPICTHQDQMVKLVPSHKVCTSVFAAQHALVGVPPQDAFFLGVATRRIWIAAGWVYAMACVGSKGDIHSNGAKPTCRNRCPQLL